MTGVYPVIVIISKQRKKRKLETIDDKKVKKCNKLELLRIFNSG